MGTGIFVLTGAGISRESGLETFRDADGAWARVRLDEVASAAAFARDPGRVHDFYNRRRRSLLAAGVRPNRAHAALARLARELPGRVTLVTQNIDDLHERAGSSGVVHMHGEGLRSRCTACGALAACREDLGVASVCVVCGAAGVLRPHVVWFGEMPLHMDCIGAALAGCGLFVAVGTSGTVAPASGFVTAARAAGARTIEINLEPSASAALFDEGRYGAASEVVPAWVDGLLAGR